MVFRCTKIGFFCQSPFRQAGCTDFCSLAGGKRLKIVIFVHLQGCKRLKIVIFVHLQGCKRLKIVIFVHLQGCKRLKIVIFVHLKGYKRLKIMIFVHLYRFKRSKIGFSGRPQRSGRGARSRDALPKKAGSVPAASQGFVGHAPRISRNGVRRQRKASTSSGVKGIFLPRRRAPSAVMR